MLAWARIMEADASASAAARSFSVEMVREQVPVGDQRPGAGKEPHCRIPVYGNPQTGLIVMRHELLLDGVADSPAFGSGHALEGI